MAEKKSSRAGKAAKAAAPKASKAVLSAEEKAALRELAQERKAALSGEAAEKAVLEKIAAMAPADRALARRIHAIVRTNAPDLESKLWYGMPAYARDGKVVCFFQDAAKFKYRYATLGFQDAARLDAGAMWPVSFALKELTAADESKIAALVKKAVT